MDKQDPRIYSAVLATRGLADLEEETIRTIRFLEADGSPAQAQLVRSAYTRLLTQLKDIAVEIAAKAQQYIKEAEWDSRVRPKPTEGEKPSLQDFLGFSEPLHLVEGSVGVNNETLLEQNVPWWWTNEEGYGGHEGRVVHGSFYGPGYSGRSAPSGALFREHPLFRAEGPQRPNSFGDDDRPDRKDPPKKGLKGERSGMLIRNPIPGRRFVQEGLERAEIEWHAKIRRARADFMREVERAMGALP